jgi:mannose/fructose/N-acetylgalactosamine-specific phosphotransferase system component IIC
MVFPQGFMAATVLQTAAVAIGTAGRFLAFFLTYRERLAAVLCGALQ